MVYSWVVCLLILLLPAAALPAPSSHFAPSSAPETVRKQDGTRADGEARLLVPPGGTPQLPELITEVVGFALTGKKPWEKLRIQDLDTVFTPAGQRLVPLLRLLKALDLAAVEDGVGVSFIPAEASTAVVDPVRHELRYKEQTIPVTLVEGVSDLTGQRDIYLPPEILAELLAMTIAWDELSYGFIVRTDRKLTIWKITPGVSLLAIRTTEDTSDLPELLPPATPPDFSLDFLELQLRPYFTTSDTGSAGISRGFAIDSPTQTLWGNGFGGRYRLQFSEPGGAWDNTTGFTRGNRDADIMLNRGDWTYSLPEAEVAAGDSAFGLNDLTFPIIRMTGVRVNGLVGCPRDGGQRRRSPGLSDFFITPQVFEGIAPVGSTVELLVNDRSIETQQVSVGTYRFEAVRLAPGTLNNIRIVITEPGGFRQESEKNIFGRSTYLPPGGLADLGGLGTDRRVQDWSTRGVIGGGRLLYGVNESLTVGTTWGWQQGFYPEIPATGLEPGARGYPRASRHWGGQLAWLPIEYLSLGGDLSLSNSDEEPDDWQGLAYKVKADVYPWQPVRIMSQFFHYDRDFFNGENFGLRDREGYALNGVWNINQQWTVASAVGGVWDNVDGQAASTFIVDFENLEITTKALPRMTIAAGVNRLEANWADGNPKPLFTLKVLASPLKDVYFDGQFSQGESFAPGQQSEFFSGLRIPGLSMLQPPRAAVSVRTPVSEAVTLGAIYWESPGRQRESVFQSFAPPGKPIRLYTELGYDANYRMPFMQGRTDYLLDRRGRNRVGLDARYEQGEWTASLIFSYAGLFSQSRGALIPLSDSSVSPEHAGVHGRVFIDANANGLLDPGEPGVEEIRVMADRTTKVLTDRAGYFLLPAMADNTTSRVRIDLETVPAIYSPTHAIQTANLGPGSLTEVNFGITPNHSISGFVQMKDPEKGLQPLPGVRVLLISARDGARIADSITAGDGSYYLGDIRPGNYYLRVDTASLPSRQTMPDRNILVEVAPGLEPRELNPPPLYSVPL